MNTSLLLPHPTLSLNATLQRLCLQEVSIETSKKLECAKISGYLRQVSDDIILRGGVNDFLKTEAMICSP